MPGKTLHTPSNPIETNTLLDAYASGQLAGQPTLISPDSIEMNSNRGVQTFDPALVDPGVLKALTARYGMPYGPAPKSYGNQELAEAILAQDARSTGIIPR